MRFKAVTLGFVLAGTALGSAALTLGRARGAAWIGQPLELLVPVQIDAGQTDSSLCAEADVFHGDSRQEGSRIQVQVMPTDQPDAFNLKITSTALIDEPVVTVYLRAGCSQKSSRKYVLLADFPNENAAPLSRTVAPLSQPAPLVIPVQAPLSPSAPAAAVPTQTITSQAEAPKAVVKSTKPGLPNSSGPENTQAKEPVKPALQESAKEPAPKKPVIAKAEKSAEAVKPATAGKPRLRLDPIETLNERVKTLESSTTASSGQEDLARDGQKMQMLQSDLKTLLDQAVKNEASLLAMRERLEKAESERVPVALVYGLGALVIFCLGALAFVLTRRPRHPAWENSALPGQPSQVAAYPVRSSQDLANPQQAVDVAMVDLDDESFDQLMGQPEQKKKASRPA